MNSYVSAEVMQATGNCNKNYYCLSSPRLAYCRLILYMINSDQIYKCLSKSPCNYKVLVIGDINLGKLFISFYYFLGKQAQKLLCLINAAEHYTSLLGFFYTRRN